MSNDRLKYLLEQYAADASTPGETKELFGWIRKSNDDALLKQKIRELWLACKSDQQLPDVDWNTIYTKIVNTPVIGKSRMSPRVAAAAAIILLLSAFSFFVFKNNDSIQPTATAAPNPRRHLKNDIHPGGNKAVLTLANGSQIILDSAANGPLIQQGNSKIIKLNSGQLAYNALNKKPGEILYNTISTPRGGEYQVVLADGSKVWLNAASSLRFPTSFTEKERNVELNGEGYFEVAHDPAKPFRIKHGDMTVEVLGTHFDINAYYDEPVVKTTLLQGSVKVSKGAVSQMITPGEQAVIASSYLPGQEASIKVQPVNVDDVVAWKNGRFIFEGNNIQSVMRQLARWYDVEVNFRGDVTNEKFVGVINRSRFENISQILEMLEKTRTVSFAVSGRSITVMPFKE